MDVDTFDLEQLEFNMLHSTDSLNDIQVSNETSDLNLDLNCDADDEADDTELIVEDNNDNDSEQLLYENLTPEKDLLDEVNGVTSNKLENIEKELLFVVDLTSKSNNIEKPGNFIIIQNKLQLKFFFFFEIKSINIFSYRGSTSRAS